jgi:cytoskeletal protein CcmA (bactofilin family)
LEKRGKEGIMWNWKDQWKEEVSPQPRQPLESNPQTKTNPEIRRKSMAQTAIIGQSIYIKGELTGNEDLTIEGKVEGKIELKDHHLTIGQGGNIKADLNAKTITIIGEVLGNVNAEEKVEIKETGKLRGDITATRIAIADGAFFKGSVDMERKPGLAKEKPLREEKPLPQPAERLAMKF